MFVFIDDMELSEWNIIVDSLKKCELVYNLFIKMQVYFVSGGVKYYGQGKWYLGELLFCW